MVCKCGQDISDQALALQEDEVEVYCLQCWKWYIYLKEDENKDE